MTDALQSCDRLTPAGDARCLIVTNNFPPTVGGAGEVYAALAGAGGGAIHVLCAATDYRTGSAIPPAAAGFPLHRIAAVRPPLVSPGLAGRVGELAIRARLFARVAALCRAHRIGVVCVADDEAVGWLIAAVQRVLRRRVLLYVHGDDLAVRVGEERLRTRRRRQFARADAIVAVSEAAARGLQIVFGVPRARVDVVPNGLDPALFRPMPPDPALVRALGLEGCRVVVTVARLVARKGVDRTIEALALLGDIADLRLVVVGDGPERAALGALAGRLGVADRVTFAGAVAHDEVARYVALGEIMAMPNRRLPDGEDEGFGLVFLEANACGKPVIAGRAGGAPEVVRDGVNGLLVDGDDAADVARALRRLLTDPALAEALGERGREMAASATWANRAGAFIAVCVRLRAANA